MKILALAALGSVAQAESMCTSYSTECDTCPDGETKYYSIDPVHGFCGESCIQARWFWLYHIFEKWLTKAETSDPCATHGYERYRCTAIHGAFGIKAVVDLYYPNNSTVSTD